MPAPDTLLTGLVEPPNGEGPVWRPILWGTLLAGTLDICAAMISVKLRGIPAFQAVKGVAAGWLGRDAFRGGEAVVALGFVSHYAIMAVIVGLFYAASRSLPLLTKQWVWSGVAYGAVVYVVMSMIVVPLSAFPRSGPPPLPDILQNLAIMIVCVGLPIAYVTRRFAGATLAAASPH